MSTPLPGQAPVRWVNHRLNGTFVVGASYLGSRYAPLPISWPVAHASAWLVSRFMPSVRDALVDNLRAVFPHETDAQLRQRAYRTCHTYTDDWMDFMRSLSWSREKVLERFTYERAERLKDALSLGRGAILVTGHFGNWEAGAVLMKALQVPLTVVAMPEADPNVNWIRHKVRGELDADTIEVRQSLDTPLQIRRRLAEGRAVAMLMDRHVERDKVPVTMFGRRAHFMGAPAMLAYLTGAPLVPIFLVREGRGRFRARPQEPILVDRTGRREEQVQRTAQQVATLLEREIEERPDCWYQFYRYWDQSSPQASADLGPGTGFRVPGTAADDLGRSGSPGESPDNPDGLINPMIPSRDSGPDSPNPVVGEAPR
ncbi:lysophospholipid acyltransferase family protein [Luteitalea sp.]|jgi:lauroyl/myristoyl acyltransferase|uniref:lysophospholipid acyltransferase family protein n=1 Tax=Luteitalea sp. TaxID=2004800 RepID=UPI0037C52784